jgi:hypothetical protein
LGHTLYAWLGVAEYFLFDPLREYLDQPLQGFRLTGKGYTSIVANSEGSLFSTELGVWLRPEADLLRIVDPQTGEAIPALDETMLRAEQEAERTAQEAHRADVADLTPQPPSLRGKGATSLPAAGGVEGEYCPPWVSVGGALCPHVTSSSDRR